MNLAKKMKAKQLHKFMTMSSIKQLYIGFVMDNDLVNSRGHPTLKSASIFFNSNIEKIEAAYMSTNEYFTNKKVFQGNDQK